MDYRENVLNAVGNTPLVKLSSVAKGCSGIVLAKLESMNPGGSVKDRIGAIIVENAEKQGLIKPGGTIVESTSGNTGVGLAMVAAVKGYKAIFTMPDKMSREKINLLKAYGAEVVVTPTAVPPDSPESFYEVAKRIVRETPNSFLANQYFNPDNPLAHYLTTGPEIWKQTNGEVDYVVAGIGTGGTISGIGKYLKEKKPEVKVVGADPIGSILKEYFYTKRIGVAKTYKVEGIGEDMIPGTTHFEYIDEMVGVSDRDSLNMARRLAREEGLLVGGSSGTACWVAIKLAKEVEKGKIIVVIFPDTGERYLSKLHSDEWMRENRLLDTSTIKIQDVLRNKQPEIPAVVSVASHDTAGKALELIKKYSVSQLPVFKDGKVVGSVSEGELMSKVLENSAVLEDKVERVMEKPLPLVDKDESVSTAMKLLAQRTPALVVTDRGAVIGVVGRFDLIEYITSE
ncbi:MAG: cystathionine beta-synthase [Candidatus Eisenbacteria bacterium]|nr:cystathionine beta-synthase [Candidatus Eisenbacteria bacterium]